MPRASVDSSTERAEHIDYVASELLTHAAVLVRLLVKQVRNREVSRTEGEVLGLLSGGPRRITELADLAGLAQPTMTLLVKRLERQGWVTREGLPDDGRVVMVTATEAGETVLEGFRTQFQAALRTDLERLSDQQLAALRAASETLGSLVDVLQAGAER
jgi:DNA-binding MarR family transcriptional regulator